MTTLKGIAQVIFSTSLLTFPLLGLMLSKQPASFGENVGTSQQPLESPTKIIICNGTSQAINTAIGFEPHFTARHWTLLNPGGCHVYTGKKYSGRVDFFVNMNSLGIRGDQPSFRKPVSAGKQCYKYVQSSNQLRFNPDTCPSNL